MGHQESAPGLFGLLKSGNKNGHINNAISDYNKHYQPGKSTEEQLDERKQKKFEIVTNYYDIATDFYEYGWGEAFHFSQLCVGETHEHSLAKHEYKLAHKLQLKAKDKVLDAGCGVGGPARRIANFVPDVNITGLNLNDYQISRARHLTEKAGLSQSVQFVKGDYCNAPFSDESFDKAYGLDATCYAAPNLIDCYREIYRLLKPGGLFAAYEWIMTDKYDSSNTYHKKIKEDILEGDGLLDLMLAEDVLEALKEVGFEIIQAEDIAPKSGIPWYSVLMPRWTLSDLKITSVGRWMTHMMLIGMETLRLAPKGSVKCHTMLCKGADGLALGGKEGIFTPMYFFLVRKPKRDQ